MKCPTKFCRNHKPDGYTHCHKCRSRAYKANYPLHYSFNFLRQRAKQRGHKFTITLAWYKEWAERTGYAAGKGKEARCLSIDRIENTKGYEPGNLRVLTLSENSRRQYAPIPGWMRALEEEVIAKEKAARA